MLKRQTWLLWWGTMRWKISLDQDDLTLAVAAAISALAISLAFI
jgi:hypothetical protein